MFHANKQTQNLLELATFIENLEPERFNMRKWGDYEEPRCICGWLMHLHARIEKRDTEYAAELLGITTKQARILFATWSSEVLDFTPKEAASVLRHIAVTGKLPSKLSALA